MESDIPAVEVKCEGVVTTDGGEGSLDGERMQAAWQDGNLSVKINR
jgi:hypothetical protein